VIWRVWHIVLPNHGGCQIIKHRLDYYVNNLPAEEKEESAHSRVFEKTLKRWGPQSARIKTPQRKGLFDTVARL